MRLRDRCRRRSILLLAAFGVVGAVALTACGGPPDAGPPPIPSQGDYVLSVLRDRTYLFDGYVVVASSIRVPVDSTHRLSVRVCGSRASCGVAESAKPTAVAGPTGSPGAGPTASPPATPGTPPPGTPPSTPPTTTSPAATPGPGEAVVKVGGMISSRLTSDMPGTITALTSTRQPVLTAEDRAEWLWDLAPTRTGSYIVVLHLSVLRGETDDPLLAEQSIEIPVTVTATAAHTARVAWFGVKEILAVLSAAGVSLVAVVGLVIRSLRHRRRRQLTTQPPAATPTDRPA